jgi:hypothetical protein
MVADHIEPPGVAGGEVAAEEPVVQEVVDEQRGVAHGHRLVVVAAHPAGGSVAHLPVEAGGQLVIADRLAVHLNPRGRWLPVGGDVQADEQRQMAGVGEVALGEWRRLPRPARCASTTGTVR